MQVLHAKKKNIWSGTPIEAEKLKTQAHESRRRVTDTESHTINKLANT